MRTNHINVIAFFIFSVSVIGCTQHEKSEATVTVLSDAVYGDVRVYDRIRDISVDDQDLVFSRRILAGNIVSFAMLLDAIDFDISKLSVQGKASLCYLSRNDQEIFSSVGAAWEDYAESREYFYGIRKFLDENNAKIMSYTAFAKYAKDKTDCYIPD